MKYVLATFLLTGCSTMAGIVPSVQNCDHVLYQRSFQDVHIEALCTLSSAKADPSKTP